MCYLYRCWFSLILKNFGIEISLAAICFCCFLTFFIFCCCCSHEWRDWLCFLDNVYWGISIKSINQLNYDSLVFHTALISLSRSSYLSNATASMASSRSIWSCPLQCRQTLRKIKTFTIIQPRSPTLNSMANIFLVTNNFHWELWTLHNYF